MNFIDVNLARFGSPVFPENRCTRSQGFPWWSACASWERPSPA